VAVIAPTRVAPFAPKLRLPGLPLLDAYILREVAAPFAFAFGAYLTFWFFNVFFLAADYIINAHAPIFLVLRFLVLRVPQSTPLAFPFACLFASLMGFGRLAQDNEITALRTSGVRFARIALTPLLLGLAMFGASYYINETVAPKSIELSTRTFYQIVYHTAQLPIVPDFFRKDDTTGDVFYVSNVESDRHTMRGVMIFKGATHGPFRTVVDAQRAFVDGDVLHLLDARITTFKQGGEVEVAAPAHDVSIGLPVGETLNEFLNTTTSDPYSVNSKALRTQIKAMAATGQGGAALDTLKMTLAQKLAQPFSAFVSVLIALPLAASAGKRGRSLGKGLGVSLSILLLFVYFVLTAVFAALGKNAALNPYLAAWMPNLIIGGAGAFMFWRIEH